MPYSSAYETDAAGRGSLPALRIGTSPTSAAIAIGSGEQEAARLDPRDDVELAGERLDHGVDHGAQGRGIRQQRRDVAEQHARLGIVGDRADERLGAGEGGHRPTIAARDSPSACLATANVSACSTPGGMTSPDLAERTDPPTARTAAEWWRTAVIYQIYPRSFADSSGDGIGDLPGITAHLDDLADLGVDAIWLSPFQRSPQKDAGYDVSDYCDVDPLFGTLADFDAMLAAGARPRHPAHRRSRARTTPPTSTSGSRRRSPPRPAAASARATSSATARARRASCRRTTGSPSSAARPGRASSRPTARPASGTCTSSTRRSPTSTGRTRRCARSSAASCASGSTAASTASASTSPTASSRQDGLPDYVPPTDAGSMGGGESGVPYWGQDGVHEIYRDWHRLVAEYDGDRALCAEAWLPTPEQTALWVRPDEMHQAFNFAYLETEWDAAALRDVIDRVARGLRRRRRAEHVGAVEPRRRAPRVAPRADRREPAGSRHRPGLARQADPRGRPAPRPRRDDAHARPARLVLPLPGRGARPARGHRPRRRRAPGPDLVPHRTASATAATAAACRCRGRATAPAYGFSPTGAAWLPQPAEWATLARDAQAGDPASTLSLYRALLAAAPRARPRSRDARVARRATATDVVAFRNGNVTVVANLGSTPIALPDGIVIAASGPVDRSRAARRHDGVARGRLSQPTRRAEQEMG